MQTEKQAKAAEARRKKALAALRLPADLKAQVEAAIIEAEVMAIAKAHKAKA